MNYKLKITAKTWMQKHNLDWKPDFRLNDVATKNYQHQWITQKASSVYPFPINSPSPGHRRRSCDPGSPTSAAESLRSKRTRRRFPPPASRASWRTQDPPGSPQPRRWRWWQRPPWAPETWQPIQPNVAVEICWNQPDSGDFGFKMSCPRSKSIWAYLFHMPKWAVYPRSSSEIAMWFLSQILSEAIKKVGVFGRQAQKTSESYDAQRNNQTAGAQRKPQRWSPNDSKRISTCWHSGCCWLHP